MSKGVPLPAPQAQVNAPIHALKIGVFLSRVRVEEKWLFEALEKRSLEYDRLDDREVKFDLADPAPWLK